MSGVVLTARARCHDAACGWACEGEPVTVEKAAKKHLREHPFAVSTASAPKKGAKP